MVKVIEGDNVRTQAYEGVVIGRSGAGINENFTVRKISYGEGVERVFPIYSPYIAEIEVIRRGKVRRAKLYYLRGRRGKSARIVERSDARARRLNAALEGLQEAEGRAGRSDADQGHRRRSRRPPAPAQRRQAEQIANLSDDDIANIDEALKLERPHREGRLDRPGSEPHRRGRRRRSAGRGRGQEGLSPARGTLCIVDCVAAAALSEGAPSRSMCALRPAICITFPTLARMGRRNNTMSNVEVGRAPDARREGQAARAGSLCRHAQGRPARRRGARHARPST